MSVPEQVARMADDVIGDLMRDHAKYDNREPFDEEDCYSIHALVASAYQRGWEDGERVTRARWIERSRREAERREKGEQA